MLTVGCGLQDPADLAWWQPYPASEGNPERPWLPWAIEVTTRPQEWDLSVREGDSAIAFQSSPPVVNGLKYVAFAVML